MFPVPTSFSPGTSFQSRDSMERSFENGKRALYQFSTACRSHTCHARSHVFQRGAPRLITAIAAVGVLLQADRSIDAGAGCELANSFGEVPGLQGESAPILPDPELHVFLFPDHRRTQ